jgi:PHP family Zn ribbon phosphoesterase
MTPEETKKNKSICPVCKKPLVVGVLSRVEELADRPAGTKPPGAIPFKNLIPLQEIIADALGRTPVAKQVQAEYHNLVEKMGNEFFILLEAAQKDLGAAASPEIAEGIVRVREGRVKIEPGYDGVYGKIKIFGADEKKQMGAQKSLF